MKTKRLILLCFCILAGAAGAAAQQYQQLPQARRGPVTLQPFDTGRSVVTFNLGGGDNGGVPGRFAVKTNLLYAGATLSPNLSFEFGVGPRTSVEATAGYNGWHNLWDSAPFEPAVDNYRRRLDHLFAKAEFRYWLRERFNGHFFGAGALFADYSVGQLDVPLLFEKEYEYDGNAYGAAITYGYLWKLNRRWAVEFSVSGGVVMMQYDKSRIEQHTDSYTLNLIDKYRKTYLGPTAAGIKLVFTIQ